MTPYIAELLNHIDIESLNAMQIASIEKHRKEDNLQILSATGSGKTLAFLLPIFDRIDKHVKETQAVIIVPSRELALQIEAVAKSLRTGLKISCCYGGRLRATEENNLIEPPALIVGTPGRIADHIRRGNITTDTITAIVLDEYDKLLELGFVEEMSMIVNSFPHLAKRTLTSATTIENLPDFLVRHDFCELNFLPPIGEEKKSLEIQQIKSLYADKIETLYSLICHFGARPTIVFCNHKESVERVSSLLRERGIYCEYYHGSLEQRNREAVLSKFRNGTVHLLITTDLASRGLDIPHIRYIVHYHLPDNLQTFTHRNGRTARMDASGTVVLILSLDEKLPEYIHKEEVVDVPLKSDLELPEKSKWVTMMMPLGKKNKISKADIVGFLTQKGQLKKEDIGLIEVKDFLSFIAVRRSKASYLLSLLKNERIKNKLAKLEIVK